MPYRTVTALTGDIEEYLAALRFLERLCKRWPGTTPMDLANARLKSMLLVKDFTSVRTLRRRPKGRPLQEESYAFNLGFYQPRRKSGLMKSADEGKVMLLLDEYFPDEAADKNRELKPIDGHVAHAVSQMLNPLQATHNHADMVFAMVRMMAAEWTCFWKRPVGTLPVPEYRLV